MNMIMIIFILAILFYNYLFAFIDFMDSTPLYIKTKKDFWQALIPFYFYYMVFDLPKFNIIQKYKKLK